MYLRSWRRPVKRDDPEIWHRFEKTTKNGDVLKFRIQTMTAEYETDLKDMYENNYIPEETFHISSGADKCREYLDAIWIYIKESINKHQLIMLCVEDTDEAKPRLAGFNICAVVSEDEDIGDIAKLLSVEPAALMFQMYLEAKKNLVNVQEKYKVDKYLGSLALAVHPDYRGLNLSKEILQTRKQLMKTNGIEISATLFTGPASQSIAQKAGFFEESKASYDEVGKTLGVEMKYKTPYAKFMSLKAD